MITVLAIIMSLMILVLALLVAGVAVLAFDNVKERDQLRVIRNTLKDREARLNEIHDEIKKDMMNRHYNDIVNTHL